MDKFFTELLLASNHTAILILVLAIGIVALFRSTDKERDTQQRMMQKMLDSSDLKWQNVMAHWEEMMVQLDNLAQNNEKLSITIEKFDSRFELNQEQLKQLNAKVDAIQSNRRIA